VDKPDAYQSEGVLYLPPMARYDALLSLPEVVDIVCRKWWISAIKSTPPCAISRSTTRNSVMISQIQNLRRTRDLLLPSLLLGRIDMKTKGKEILSY